jgi:hypothetical protein
VPKVVFTRHLERHLACPAAHASGKTVRDVLEGVFQENPRLRSYILDDQGALRQHMVVFVDGRLIQDRVGLKDELGEASEVYVMQALSGG